MATVTLLGSTFTTTAGSKTVVATPAAGDLIVVVSQSTGVQPISVSDNNSDGFGGTTLYTNTFPSFSRVRIDVRQRLIGSATSTTWTADQTGSSGGGLAVYAIRSHGNADNVNYIGKVGYTSFIAGATPTATLSGTTSSGNPLIGAVSNNTNTATLTPPTTGTLWTEHYDTGYNTPVTGAEGCSLAGGAAVSSVAWGSTSISAGNVNVAEILTNQSAPPAVSPFIALGGRSTAYSPSAGVADALDTVPFESADWNFEGTKVFGRFSGRSRTLNPLTPSAQTPTIALIDQTGVINAITVQTTVSVSLGLVDNTGVIYAVTPQSNYNAAIALIDQSGTLFAFTRVDQTAPLALINQTGVLFDVTPSQSGGAQNVNVALIDQSGTMFGVGANQSLTLALIDQSGAVFALGQIKQTVPLGLIDQSYVMYGLTVNQRLQALGLIDQTGVINALAQVKQSEPVSLIDQSGVVFTLTQVKQTATLSIIDQSGVLFNVTPSLGLSANVSTIDQSGTMFALAAENQSLPALALIDQTGTMIGVTAAGGESISPSAFIRWFIRTQQVCKNQHHYHYPHYDIVLSGTEYFIPTIPDGWTET